MNYEDEDDTYVDMNFVTNMLSDMVSDTYITHQGVQEQMDTKLKRRVCTVEKKMRNTRVQMKKAKLDFIKNKKRTNRSIVFLKRCIRDSNNTINTMKKHFNKQLVFIVKEFINFQERLLMEKKVMQNNLDWKNVIIHEQNESIGKLIDTHAVLENSLNELNDRLTKIEKNMEDSSTSQAQMIADDRGQYYYCLNSNKKSSSNLTSQKQHSCLKKSLSDSKESKYISFDEDSFKKYNMDNNSIYSECLDYVKASSHGTQVVNDEVFKQEKEIMSNHAVSSQGRNTLDKKQKCSKVSFKTTPHNSINNPKDISYHRRNSDEMKFTENSQKYSSCKSRYKYDSYDSGHSSSSLSMVSEPDTIPSSGDCESIDWNGYCRDDKTVTMTRFLQSESSLSSRAKVNSSVDLTQPKHSSKCLCPNNPDIVKHQSTFF